MVSLLLNRSFWLISLYVDRCLGFSINSTKYLEFRSLGISGQLEVGSGQF